MMRAPLDDAHCHVASLQDPEAFARDAAGVGSRVLAVTVTPDEFSRCAPFFGGSVSWAVGLHPWWVPTDEEACAEVLARFDSIASSGVHFVGEVGLDFSSRYEGNRAQQVRAFDHVARTCANMPGALVSIHAVRSASAVLDILEETGCASACSCVLHWFSGSSDELTRARRLGCFFSVGRRMLATRRGRAYARAIPPDRLILETDAPWGDEAVDFAAVEGELARTLDLLARERGERPDDTACALRRVGDVLFGAGDR